MSEKTTSSSDSSNSGPRPARVAAVGLTGLAFIATMTVGIGFLHHRANALPIPDASPPVAVAVDGATVVGGYDIVERFTGRLEPARRTRIAFERDGLVTKVLYDEGDSVGTGALLARLDTAQLETGRRLLKAERRELEAQLALADLELERNAALENKGWASRQRYDESRFRVARLRAGIERIDALLEANRIDLDKSEVRAPFSGTIASRIADEGAVVAAGAAVVELLEDRTPQARIGVSVHAADTLELGGHYSMRANGATLNGRLTALRPDLHTGTQTVTAIFEVDDAQAVPFGSLVELALSRHVKSRGVWIPLAALSEGRKGIWSVFTVIDGEHGQVAALEAVEVIHATGSSVFVRGTFEHDANIIVSGTNRIVSGQRISVAGGS